MRTGGLAVSSVQSIDRAFAVLRCLSGGAAGVTDISERVTLPKSTVSRLLSTLEDLGAVEQVSTGGPYRIGPGLLRMAASVLPARSLVDAARPHLVELMESLGEATGLSIMEGRSVHYLDQVESRNAVQVRDWTGQRVPLHVVPSGLVLLAYAPRTSVDAYLDRPLEKLTTHTIVDHRLIRKRLREIATDGSAWVLQEFSDGINSIAAPVRDATGNVVAALHAHGPTYRFPGKQPADVLAGRVVDAAARVSTTLKTSASG
jgi:DNA-binding IclR family transcriptional regulator